MTPKDKANELVNRFKYLIPHPTEQYLDIDEAKQCALICVAEICEAINWHEFEVPNEEFNYWNRVKLEIQRL
jgi:hypothetical protein